MKRKELLREDIIKEKVKGGDCKTMPDTLYNILYEKSKVYGVRVLYEEDFPLDELTEFIQQEIDRAREEGRKEELESLKKMWDNDELGDAPEYGRAGAGLMKRWFRNDIDARLGVLEKPINLTKQK